MEVGEWLRRLGLSQYESTFVDNGVDVEILSKLTAEDLKDLGVTLIGHRRKLLDAIAAIGATAPGLPAVDAGLTVPVSPRAQTAERRQLTIMFYDLVGWTALSTRVDPEELRDFASAYHRSLGQAIVGLGGFVARYLGDGGLVYFGYPQAHEDDTERAVLAGLAAIAAVRKLTPPAGTIAEIRIGIATGLVVVGDIVGSGEHSEGDVAGEAPNLAARLQALAEPNTIVIAASTRALLGDRFEYEPLAPQSLKGFGKPIDAYRILRPNEMRKRLEARRQNIVAPLVGRSEEIDLLLRRWERASAGQGQIVFISGEPGIGKSRLARTLRDRIAAERHLHFWYYCSPYHTNSTLYPILQQIEHAADFAREDSPHDKLDKLEILFRRTVPQATDIALIADLLMLPASGRYPATPLPAGLRRQRTLDVLLRDFESLATVQPLLVVVEDMHWIDPTTRELLHLMIDRVPHLPVLLVATCRPEVELPWLGQLNTTLLTLGHLDRDASIDLIRQVTATSVLADEIQRQIVDRADGIPLFIEELTQSIVECEVQGIEPSETAARTTARLGLPVSLHASLMARLDRIPAAKPIAQVGAVIGREFSYEMMASLMAIPESSLIEGLAQLSSGGLVFERGRPPNSTYRFKHALVRDAAYDTLLRSKRRELHARIGHAFETQFPEMAETEPDVLAHHFNEARYFEKAVDYWERAGRLSVRRSAMAEAAAHLQKGLETLLLLPETSERHRRELSLQTGLGNALIATTGYSSPHTGEVYVRAHALCEHLADTENLVRVANGLWSFYAMREEMDSALKVSEELLDRCDDQRFAGLRLTAHRLLGASLVQLGRLGHAREHLETADRLLGSTDAVSATNHSGAREDDLVAVPAYLSVLLALTGNYDQARAKSATALELSRRSFRPHRRAFALGVAGYWFHLILNEDDPEIAAEGTALAAEHGFPYWAAFALQWHGVSLAKAGRADEGIALVKEGIRQNRLIGATWSNEVFLGTAAEFAPSGETMALIDEAISQVVTTGVVWFLPELQRIRAKLLSQSGDWPAAEMEYLRAIDTARYHGARHWELRATIGLAELRRQQGKRAEARELLSQVYHQFTGQASVPDLKQAAAILDELDHEYPGP